MINLTPSVYTFSRGNQKQQLFKNKTNFTGIDQQTNISVQNFSNRVADINQLGNTNCCQELVQNVMRMIRKRAIEKLAIFKDSKGDTYLFDLKDLHGAAIKTNDNHFAEIPSLPEDIIDEINKLEIEKICPPRAEFHMSDITKIKIPREIKKIFNKKPKRFF